MSVRTLKDTGSDYPIPQRIDASVYSLISEDCIIKGLGDEFATTFSTSSLIVTFTSGSQAIIDGNAFWLPTEEKITLPSNSKFNVCLRIDTSQPNGSTGSIVCLTDEELKSDKINNQNSAIRDLPIYIVTTDSNGVTASIDKRTIRDGDIVKGITGILPQVLVHDKEDTIITARCGNEVITGICDSNNQVTLYLTTKGIWTIANTSGDVETLDITDCGNYEVNFLATIMGIKFDLNSSLPAGIRTDSAEGLEFSASVGNTAGHSDFWDMPIYKDWFEHKRMTLDTGDVVSRIPAFYCRRYRDDDYEYWKVADMEVEDFQLHDAFNRQDGVRDYLYIGCYETSSNNCSLSGKTPTTNITRASFRSYAKAKGSKWSQVDLATWSAFQMLVTIECGTRDVQTAYGEGYSASSHTACISTGTCDSVPNLCGRPAGTSNNVGVIVYGIENPWGNLWKFLDGINWNSGTYYICTNQDNFADDTASNYIAMAFSGASCTSGSYISQMGIDSDHMGILLPTQTNGSSSTYYCDLIWLQSGWRVLFVGGGWSHGLACGFCFNFSGGSSVASSDIGSRLLYAPLQ